MTLQAKIDDDIGGSRVVEDEAAKAANSKGGQLRQLLDRIANVQKEIDGVMDAAKGECSPLREDIAAIKKEANEKGFSRKEFNALVRKDRLERQIKAIPSQLDADQQDRYEDMLHALGELAETPLGQAAAEKHPGKPKDGAAAH